MKKNIKKGFTLAEVLIVVAIISILVGISFPVFADQIENSREKADINNIRGAYARVQLDAIKGKGNKSEFWIEEQGIYQDKVVLEQTKEGWQSIKEGETLIIGDTSCEDIAGWNTAKQGSIVVIEFKGKAVRVYIEGSTPGDYDGDAGNNQNTNPPVVPPNTDQEQEPGGLDDLINDWNTIVNSGNGYNVVAGTVYKQGSKIYFALNDRYLNAWDIQNNNFETFKTWFLFEEFTGKIWKESDFNEIRYDVNKGDLCKVGDSYYVFKDGGNTTSGPVNSPGQWQILIETIGQ